MLTADNYARNLETAKNLAARAVGASSPYALTYEQRIRYTRVLAGIVMQYPASFDDATRKAAASELASQPHSPLSESTMGQLFGEFADAAAAEASATLPAVGNKLLAAAVVLGIVAVLAYVLPSGLARARERKARA